MSSFASPLSPVDEDGLPVVTLHRTDSADSMVTPVKPPHWTKAAPVAVESAAAPTPGHHTVVVEHPRSVVGEAMIAVAAAAATVADATAPTVMSEAKRHEASRVAEDEPLLIEVRARLQF
jgi:hypothetical protein